MTVIAGFQCQDALMMCADSEESMSRDSKSQTRKIESFVSGDFAVAVGGAGDADLIQYVQYEIKQRFDRDPPKPDAAEAWLQSFAKEIWNACIRPYRGFATELVPDASFLIGLQVKGSHNLYRWERNTIWPIPKSTHTSIGIGVIQSQPLLTELEMFDLPAHQMLLFAVRAMLRVKQLVQGCGGKTEVVLLLNDGLVMTPATAQIDSIERLVEYMDRFLLFQAGGFIAGAVSTSLEADLNGVKELLTRLRSGYEKTVPDLFSWYQRGEIRF